jgi:hypothetical protein
VYPKLQLDTETKMKSWKKLEQKVARLRGTERTPLSGGNSRQTRSDKLDDTFFIECKLRKDPAVWNLYEQVEELAKKENKIPVLVIKKKGKHGELFIVNDRYLKEFIENWEANNEESNSNNQNQ